MPMTEKRRKSRLSLNALKSCFASCVGKRPASENPSVCQCSSASDPSKGDCNVRKSISFRQALFNEDLLIPKCTFIPDENLILRICHGFEARELTSPKQIYHSYTLSRWDAIIDKPRCRFVSELIYPNDSLVDGIPASVWLDCLEPSLYALIALNKLKRRRTNLRIKTNVGARQSNSISDVMHGDFDLEPDNPIIIGPPGPPPGYVQTTPIIPTDEVRPAIWILHTMPEDDFPDGSKTFSERIRETPIRHRHRFTKRSLHCANTDDPNAAAFPGLTVDDMPRSDDDDDSEYDSSDENDDTGEGEDTADNLDDGPQEEISIYALRYLFR